MRTHTPARLIVLFLAMTPLLIAREAKRDSTADRSAEDREREQEELRCRVALDALEASDDAKTMARHLEVLREGLPDNREVLLEAFGRGTTRVRVIVLNLLASPAAGGADEGAIRQGLRDSSELVRSIAVQGVHTLGEKGAALLVDHLLSETRARNRLVTLKALVEHHGGEELVPDLVRALARERDPVVRRECIEALETLSGKKFGDDLRSWKEHVREIQTLRKIRKEILYRVKRS